MDEAIELSKLGKGSLVTPVVTADYKEARQYVIGICLPIPAAFWCSIMNVPKEIHL
jgi:hypothetical protein